MKCPKCQKGNIIVRLGQYGLFAACTEFPKCKHTDKLENFILDILKKEGINIYSWDHECWKCHKTTKVYTYFINKQLKPYMEEYTELDNLGIGTIKKIDDYLMKKYQAINNNYSNTTKHYAASNNCSHCNALIGNYFITEDPHEIFNEWLTADLAKYIVDKIPISVLNLTTEDFKNLKDNCVQIV